MSRLRTTEENDMTRTKQIANYPEVALPEGRRFDRYDGPTWILVLPDGRELRLSEPVEGKFTIDRCYTEAS